jgi:hypothetical protein
MRKPQGSQDVAVGQAPENIEGSISCKMARAGGDRWAC